MKQSEKKLLLLAGAVFVALMVVRVVPLIMGFYQGQQDRIAALERRLENYTELLNDSQRWMGREQEMSLAVEELKTWVFPGANANLIASSLQRSLRDIVESSGVNIRQMSVARITDMDGWVVVSQEMSFTIDQSNILKFLAGLEESRPRLLVTRFSITRARREYTGNLTVAGFSRREGS